MYSTAFPVKILYLLSDIADLNTATLFLAMAVIPAKAGIQRNTGFRVKPGMTN
jgi:hypothetical protein